MNEYIQTNLLQNRSACPNAHHPILPPLRQIPVLDPHPLHTALPSFIPAIPMSPISLIVDLRHGLTDCSDDAPRVEHHARDWIIVGIGVVDGAGSEVPDLN